MTRWGFVGRNLRYHIRGNIAVMLGVWLGAAVLTGALLVGDSLKASLRERSLRQLGPIESILFASNLFRAEVASGMPGTVRPALVLSASIRSDPTTDADPVLINRITVYGITDSFWQDFEIPTPVTLNPDEPRGVLISEPLARELRVKVGDRLELSTQSFSGVPRSSFLGKRDTDESTDRFNLTVAGVLPAGHPGNALDFIPNPRTPLNLYISLDFLQSRLKQRGKVNALFANGASTESLQKSLASRLNLDDRGLKVHIPKTKRNYISVESRQLILPPTVADTTLQVAKSLNLVADPTIVYLANRLTGSSVPPNALQLLASTLAQPPEIPYSIVAAVNPQAPAPLGPLPGFTGAPLAVDEMLLLDWKQSPLKLQPGDRIRMEYFDPEIEGNIRELDANFRFRGLVERSGVAADPDLAPEFPGITDKLAISDWDPPFPFFGGRVSKADEQFWNQSRTTPKAYIHIDRAKELFGNRFGSLTSIRIAPTDGSPIREWLPKLTDALTTALPPESSGFQFQPIREQLLSASNGSTDFGMLFTAFSFFLIGSALMLVGLLVRLNLERRASEIGILLATGFSRKSVRNLLLGESLLIATIGAILGVGGAILYADWMLQLFASLWANPEVASFLHLAVTPATLMVGLIGTLVMTAGTIVWALRMLANLPTSDLVAGRSTQSEFTPTGAVRLTISRITLIGGILGAVVALVLSPFAPPGEMRAMAFFSSGGCLLTAGLAGLWIWLKKPKTGSLHVAGRNSLTILGFRNASRQPTRSILTAGLLASASFLLVAVESFHREPEKDFLQQSGGSGGYALSARLSLPLYLDPNSAEGQAEIENGLRRLYQDQLRRRPNLPPMEERIAAAQSQLQGVTYLPLRIHGGDDASCLNLYQATKPRLIAVPKSLTERGGFQFSSVKWPESGKSDNPWTVLFTPTSDGAIPVFVEENTAMWQLKKGIGDRIEISDSQGKPRQLQIAGLLKDSVFQSELVMADVRFIELFPQEEGFLGFLASTPPGKEQAIRELLQSALATQGAEIEFSQAKLASYLAVQNSYLTTFQILGGFGLLLGVIGMAIILLRGIWERRKELALLQATGYRPGDLRHLVFAENCLLLTVGLGIGLLAAAGSIAPHLAAGNRVPWMLLGGMLSAVVAVGLLTTAMALRSTTRVPIITALRRE
ncbi:FtsX-like permease family protein [Tuwongella immobilis]|uniref:ABC3 transporter permease protein domain-containing protein n=1 Tax=Tuwongella immobilis TaxID=692036 RepID=A0A6C2YMG7_9BACT|nr:ABC transporter permease [Tuwongella immobilis]VIP02788.1 membrane protein containing permase : Uncharacterized protein OS=Planctomyces maris DSM 8797 GN=PM8797T_12748 PE=4 SV=1: MacB_PCD: FtsX: FtsX [Tuwongella immobilis]VTS02452.1 membrane protein containing permase : Uncharacterized protein OS=Planctomyces maris DSM 8797 GN=PM8797T_12748 PE=4 SV=1: MacB_PCD: FtsX: FtsX [Tuwongella immobilis]